MLIYIYSLKSYQLTVREFPSGKKSNLFDILINYVTYLPPLHGTGWIFYANFYNYITGSEVFGDKQTGNSAKPHSADRYNC